MAFLAVAGTNIKLSGTGVTGEYVYFVRPKTQGTSGSQMDSSYINYMFTYLGSKETQLALVPVWKDNLVGDNYHEIMENNAGTLQAISRILTNPGDTVTARYGWSVPYPKCANICGLKITVAGTNDGTNIGTITVSAKEDVVGV